MEELNNIAKQFITDTNADGKIDLADVTHSLQSLLADASGKLDLSGMISKLQNVGLSETVASWLSDGKNTELSIDSLTQLIDEEKIKQFAAKLNIDLDTAKTALANAIPSLIDQVSSGGNLMEKFNEGISMLQESATEIAATADAKSGGLLGKIKGLFS